MAQRQDRRHGRGHGGRLEASALQRDVTLPHRSLTRALCQNATQPRAIFTFGTAMERIAPESLFQRRTQLFTARCRSHSEAAHHIQHHNNLPQPAADDKG